MICRTALFAVLLLASPSFVSSQSELSEDSQVVETEARKVDEFGRMGECALGARLDNFAIELQKNPAARAFIIGYQSQNILPMNSRSGSLLLMRARNYLVTNRGIDPGRHVSVNGGYREQETIELWLVPPGAAEPSPTNTVEKPEIPRGKTYLFGRLALISETTPDELIQEISIPIPEETVEEESEQTEETVDENTEESVSEETEIEEQTPELSEEELNDLKFHWAAPSFAEAVKNETGGRGVIIYYADETAFYLDKLRAHIEEGRNHLAHSENLKIENFEIVFGGYRENPQVEFWIVPKGSSAPAPTPEIRQHVEEPQ